MNPNSFHPLLTPEFVTDSLHLTIPFLPEPKRAFSNVCTDSRKVREGCLFVALPGEKFDGHDYIEKAIAQGARGVIYRRGFTIPASKGVCLFPVEDPVKAYRRLAGQWRHQFSIPVIAVAGSAGKTTTKELLAAILHGRWPHVLKTQGSQNGFIGIPMTLLELRPEHQAAVIEVGIDEVGAMKQHMALLGATASVLTMVGPEHLEKLQDVPTVAREESIALSHVAHEGGLIVINLDDDWIKPHWTMHLEKGRKIAFSQNKLNESGEFLSGELSSNGQNITIQGLGIPPTTIPLPLLGKHNASNLLAAIAVAAGVGLTIQEINTGLKTFKGAEGRSEVYEIPNGITTICDYYNAQPASVKAGLELLTQISERSGKNGIRWACLADMLELGPDEEKFHRMLADQILSLNIEKVLLFGSRMKALSDELEKRKFKGYYSHFSNHSELAEVLKHEVKTGDTILIKGSRGMKMEEVWKILEPTIRNGSPSTNRPNTATYS